MRPAVAALLCVLSATVSARWAPFVRSEVPKTADGKPNLDAPPPRLPSGKIDFSGTWESRIQPSGRLGGPMVPNIGDARTMRSHGGTATQLAGTTVTRSSSRPSACGTMAGSTSTARPLQTAPRSPSGSVGRRTGGWIDTTVDDAKAYTRPWTVRVNWRLGADEELIEFVCNENEQDAKRLRISGSAG